jgi:peroxiredoxin
MKRVFLNAAAVACMAPLALLAGAASAADVTGMWAATTQIGDAPLPFKLELRQKGSSVSGHFFDGERANTPSDIGHADGDHIHLEFKSYAASFDADVKDGALKGEFKVSGHVFPITAVRASGAAQASPAPDIGGEWIIPYASPKGEKAWRLIVQENPATGKTAATILRIDGDTGTLSGAYSQGRFQLAHFAGERPAVLSLTPDADGGLSLSLTDTSGSKSLKAIRADKAKAIGLAPDDPTSHTTVKNPDESLRFSFPNLSGQVVANTDARFKGKVVLVNVLGSWCPNCHDEAPFLQGLYARLHAKGLEIVGLDFEQPDQLADPKRLRAFVERYGVTYDVLIAGQPKEVNDKLPQAVGLNAWPTTFIIGRDGKVRGAHVGFTSPGSGARDVETRAEIEKAVEALLAEPAPKT